MFEIIEEDDRLRFRMTSDPENVAELLREVRHQYRDCSPKDSAKLYIILRELVENAVRHGNEGQSERQTFCEIADIGAKKLRITVADEGEGFSHQEMDLTLSGRVTRKQVRGIPLVNALADILEYNETGNMATAIFSRNGA